MTRAALACLLLTLFFGAAASGAEYDAPVYDDGIASVKRHIAGNEFEKAEAVLKAMRLRYPGNREILGMLASVLFWQKKYDEALETYQSIPSYSADAPVVREIERVLSAKRLQEIDALLAAGETGKARRMLETLWESGKDPYEAGYRLGMLYIREREYGKALELFRKLRDLYPEDRGFAELFVESLILAGDIAEAKRALASLPSETQTALVAAREDLLFRVRREYVKITGSVVNYSGSYSTEQDLSVDIAKRVRELTLVFHGARIRRFGLYDSQAGLDIYSKLGERTKRWGYVSVRVSPDADFLPRLSVGAELYQGHKDFEFSLGYRRMQFKDASADIIIPGVTCYLPAGLSFNERVYYVPGSGSFSFLSTLHFEPHHRFRGFYSVGLGQTSERVGSLSDLKRAFSFSSRLGAEYRFVPSFSIGAEASYEYRKTFYSTSGITLFSRYWW